MHPFTDSLLLRQGFSLLLICSFSYTAATAQQRTITGRILHSEGLPAANLLVEAWDYDVLPDPDDDRMAATTTDVEGRYTIRYDQGDWDQDLFNPTNRLPDIYLLVYRRIDDQWVKVRSTRSNPRNNVNTNTLDMGIEAVTTIFGTLTDAEGTPLEGFTVRATDADPGDAFGDDFMGEDQTDAQGRYTIWYEHDAWDGHLSAPANRPEVYLIASGVSADGVPMVERSETYNNWRFRDNLRVNFRFGVTNEITPPTPSCTNETFIEAAPPELLNCDDPHCGRLIDPLRRVAQRTAARTWDARDVLLQSAVIYYGTRGHPEITEHLSLYRLGLPITLDCAQAVADLSVTGWEAYRSFRQLGLEEGAFIDDLRTALAVLPNPNAGDLEWAARQAIRRAYRVAWALRGPVTHREGARAALGWIAISGEDDSPHRPVNVRSALYPQFNLIVPVPPDNVTGMNDRIDVDARYAVISDRVQENVTVDLESIPPENHPPVITGDIILFLHGHSSRLEEALSLASFLMQSGHDQGRPVTIIAMDLPSNGYSQRIDHERVSPAPEANWNINITNELCLVEFADVIGGRANTPPLQSNWNSGYPILEFYEAFILAFVEQLERQQPEISRQIIGVIGGSLGGNMGLRLARQDQDQYPWLHSVVSWSPASSWESFARATLWPFEADDYGRSYDIEKALAVFGTQHRLSAGEIGRSRHCFFYGYQAYVSQSGHWYHPDWPCAENAVEGAVRVTEEIYSATFRRWHWRVAHEQLIYSHRDSNDPSGSLGEPPRFFDTRSRLLLAAGSDDNSNPIRIYDNTRQIARSMTMVDLETLFLLDTGHSMHTEHPAFFAEVIVNFLFQRTVPSLPSFLIGSAAN